MISFKKLVPFLLILFALGFSSQSFADDAADASQDMTRVLCNVIDVIQGPTGKTVCIIVIITLSIGLFLGKVTWGVAIAIAVGMGILFGAGQLVGFLSNTGEGSTTNPCPGHTQS